jgi:hypothetical protein
MDRFVLLVLLGIPILVVIHAAGGLFSTIDCPGQRLPTQTRGQSTSIPTYFVVERSSEPGA